MNIKNAKTETETEIQQETIVLCVSKEKTYDHVFNNGSFLFLHMIRVLKDTCTCKTG